jgi:hypothetical protein
LEQVTRTAVAKHRKRTSSQEKQAMRALILAATVLAILFNANAAKAGLSTNVREASASADTVTPSEANHPSRVRTEGRAHRPRGIGGPIGAIGGAIGGLFHR